MDRNSFQGSFQHRCGKIFSFKMTLNAHIPLQLRQTIRSDRCNVGGALQTPCCSQISVLGGQIKESVHTSARCTHTLSSYCMTVLNRNKTGAKQLGTSSRLRGDSVGLLPPWPPAAPHRAAWDWGLSWACSCSLHCTWVLQIVKTSIRGLWLADDPCTSCMRYVGAGRSLRKVSELFSAAYFCKGSAGGLAPPPSWAPATAREA